MPPQNGSCPAGPGNAEQRKGYQQGYHGGRQGRHERPRLLGKLNTTPDERILEDKSGLIKGIRPCQWLVGYPWSTNSHEDPLWLTASICYDATDLGLMADLRCQSDVLAIPAFNRDVKTFDQMALALHYHMFQLVVVVNNGTYGGSNAYLPLHEEYNKQIFHLHGQPQAGIAFFEIENIADLKRRWNVAPPKKKETQKVWKQPPACSGTP